MAKHSDSLSKTFHALSDATRRAVLARLVEGPAAVKELAEPFEIGLPAFLKHVKTLEEGGLLTTRKSGRVRVCALSAAGLSAAETWLGAQRRLWEAQADRLATFVETDPSKENNA